jgi:hypothetical protein
MSKTLVCNGAARRSRYKIGCELGSMARLWRASSFAMMPGRRLKAFLTFLSLLSFPKPLERQRRRSGFKTFKTSALEMRGRASTADPPQTSADRPPPACSLIRFLRVRQRSYRLHQPLPFLLSNLVARACPPECACHHSCPVFHTLS